MIMNACCNLAETTKSYEPFKKEFLDAYYDFECNYNNVEGNTLDAVLYGQLKMYAIEYVTEIENIEELLKKTEEIIPAINRICKRPKSHLKSINEVRPIDAVKRVGYEAVSYLASHSEDWLARTASGLKPARIYSRVEEIDLQIYENRFVKMVIDAVGLVLRRQCKKLKGQLDQITQVLGSSVEMGSFGFNREFAQSVSILIQDDRGSADKLTGQKKLAKEFFDKATQLQKKISSMKQSKLYKANKKVKAIVGNINETNILLMDKDYNAIYKFWKKYQKLVSPKVSDQVKIEQQLNLQPAYNNFCKTLCEFTAYTMNYKQCDDGSLVRSADDSMIKFTSLNNCFSITISDSKKRELKIEKGLVSPIKTGEKSNKFEFDGEILYWDSDVNDAEIEIFSGIHKHKVVEKSAEKKQRKFYQELKQAITKKQIEYGESKFQTILFLTPFCNVDDETQNVFSKYMMKVAEGTNKSFNYTIVAMPKCELAEQRLTKYAKKYGEKTLFLPLTLFDINSYRRLQNLFLRMIVSLGKDKCPQCGGIVKNRKCQECGLIITNTNCSQPECKHNFTYLNYEINENVAKEMIRINSDKFFVKDSLFQYKDIVELSIENGLRPLCPKCGK